MLPLVLAAAAAAATAAPVGERPPPDDDVSPKIRAGVVVGVSVGGGVGAASGYPNDATKIGDPAYHSASGAMLGSSTSFLLMGALSDYLNFGFWFTRAVSQNGDWRSECNGGGLRVDVFPLIVEVPRLRGLGLFGQFGIGGGNLASKTASGGPGSSGTQSFVAAGGFYEWSFWRFAGGHFGAGPSLEYDAVFSQPFERHGLLATARLVFYGGP
jgi:hypothetical protein